jgi:hypothetical protein
LGSAKYPQSASLYAIHRIHAAKKTSQGEVNTNRQRRRVFMEMMIMRKEGVLKSWHVNGYGMVAAGIGELYFLHASNVTDGEPKIGSIVEFEVAPPFGKGRFEQAVKAAIRSEVSK